MRLMLTLTPIVCVVAAIAISNVLDTYLVEDDAEDEEAQVEKKGKSDKGNVKNVANVSSIGIKSPTLKFPVIAGLTVLLIMFGFHCTYVTSSAYSSPSVVLASQNRDGSQHIIVSDCYGFILG